MPYTKGTKKKGGRKKGTKNIKTIVKQIEKEQIDQRISKNAISILDSQISLAKGLSFLFCTKIIKKGKETKKVTTQIEDPEIIRAFIDGEFENSKDEYYFITVQKPDGKACNDLLDRRYGKATQPNINKEVGEEKTIKQILEELNS